METVELIEALKKKKWLDLSHEIHQEIPHFNAFSPVATQTLFTVEDDGFLVKEYQFVTQYGTHIDAPNHFALGKRALAEIGLKELVLPLYVIHKEKAVEENADYELSVADILAFEQEFGQIPAESFVAFASGWSQRFQTPVDFYNKDEKGVAHVPGWSLEALKFLAEERSIAAIGHETLDTDSGLEFSKNQALLGEFYWLSQDKYQVEVLNNLSQVPATGSVIVIGFPNFREASGFPVRAQAILPAEESIRLTKE